MLFSWRYRYVLILFLGVYSYLNIFYTVGDKLFDFSIPYSWLFILLLVVVAGIWECNRLTILVFEKNFRILRKINPLISLFIVSLLNVIIVTFLSLQIIYVVLEMPPTINSGHLKLLVAFGFRVNLFLNCVNAIVYYMNRYRESQVEAEQLRKVTVEAQFEALRNQINPHFLFNCFNALSTLVYKDADTSSMFISQLSNVYRYLLYNNGKKIIALSEELRFLESYFYLLRIRFGENLAIQNELRDDQDVYVPPSVLQMLIENAIKHNVISKKNPLLIRLYYENDYVVILNSLRQKPVSEESTHVGLKNISDRYRLLTDKPVEISNTGDVFIVKVPLLQLDLNESPYR